MIEVKEVSKRFGETHALKPLSFQFAAGKTTAIIGPSGCGKSTLLRIIIGLIPPTAGTVSFDGQPVSDWLQVRRRMGYVIQDGGLFPHLNGRQNVALMAQHLGWDPAKVESRTQELCSLARLPLPSLSRFPGELSGGQKQRLSLMRALFLSPNALLLDEPLAALDPMVRSALQTDLKAIFGEFGQTVILVTHDMGEAGYLADEIVLMNEGEIVQRGSLSDLRDRPSNEFVQEFMSAQRSLVTL